ncbi:MAG: FAD:protein FMN transferase [Butyrivibrio sp.]|nr:FAD:protein FMN transferase [Butyrivibrio sp.]
MDTVMELEIAGNEELLPEAEEKIRDLERRLSVTDNDSEISLLNKNKQALLSNDTATILANALSICDETDGALDVSIYPVLKEWGFTTGEYKVPDDTRITELLKEVDYNKINMVSGEEDKENKNDISVQIPENMEVDLGSVVKGYTSTMLYDFFTENGVKSGLINLGGNVQCIGTKPNGEMWNVAIKSPYLDSKTGIIGVLKASDEAVITSGGYERYFEEDGKIYHHIIDPSTGKPADNGLSSVTIIGKDGLKCDGYSTALYIKGLDSAISFWKERDDFEAVFVTSDGNVYVTEGISDRFLLSSEYAQKTIKIISK